MILVFGRGRQVHEGDLDNEETPHLHRVTVILELLQHKINIDEPHRLLPTLFVTLARYIKKVNLPMDARVVHVFITLIN